MRVATWNIHRGRSTAGFFRAGLVPEVLAEIGADLVALQEAQHWLRPMRAMLDARALAAAGLDVLEVAGSAGAQGWRSNVVLLRRGARLLRPAQGLRLGGLEPRGAVLAELDLGAGAFRLIATHLSLGAARRARQAAALVASMRDGAALPTLLLGDLNEWRPGGSALRVLAPVFGAPPPVATFPAFRPMLALDRIMGHPAGLVAGVAAHDTQLARRASDHLPLVAWIEPRLLAG
jgi:endonuclease/exonuclease/phosphatase family metal-dependent hydrolase